VSTTRNEQLERHRLSSDPAWAASPSRTRESLERTPQTWQAGHQRRRCVGRVDLTGRGGSIIEWTKQEVGVRTEDFVGGTQTGALVGADGAVDWPCR
jgi:hypothetical protein